MNKSEDLIEFVPDRPGHDLRYALDSTKINELGWKTRHNFEQALNETIQWYQDNRQWWQSLIGSTCPAGKQGGRRDEG